FIEGTANVSQQYFTPFGAQPVDLSNATNNRYTSQLYRISPFIKGDASDRISYELRNDNIWSRQNNAPTSVDSLPNVAFNPSNSYTNQTIGRITREPVPLGWQLDYNRTDIRFTDQEPQLTGPESVRLLS